MNITNSTLSDLIQEKPYQHYSFDLWLTIIRSHPSFKASRAEYFHRNYNPGNVTLEAVNKAFRKVDHMCNIINEKTGKNIDAEEMYLMVLHELDPHDDFGTVDMEQLYNEVEQIALALPPQLYAENTIAVLQALRSRGATLNILSNTAFIKGSTLRKVFTAIGLDGLFDFCLFSDETGFSKPHPRMFALMHEEVSRFHTDIPINHIVHIGDNPRADIAGARAYGINAYLVHNT